VIEKICWPNMKELRQLVVNEKGLTSLDTSYQGWEKEPMNDYSWVKETPVSIHDKAAHQLAQAYSNAAKKYGWGNFEVKF